MKFGVHVQGVHKKQCTKFCENWTKGAKVLHFRNILGGILYNLRNPTFFPNAYTLKNKGSKRGFHSNAREEPFLSSHGEYSNNQRTFFHIKNLLWNGEFHGS